MSWKSNKAIIIVISVFVLCEISFLLFYKDVWWDSAVYIGMGKYIYSLGSSGLWEDYRLPLLPLILGLGWKLHFDLIYYARFISLLFAVLTLIITFKVGKDFFSPKIGILATFFTAFSYTFFFFSPNILTEIPSAFFALLSIYFFFKKKFFLVGLFAGISIMFRIFHMFVFAGIFISFLIYSYKKRNFFNKILYMAGGILIPILSYYLLNYYLYNDIFQPLKVQNFFVHTTAWNLYRDWWFYFAGLLWENFFLLILLFLPFFFRKNNKLYTLALSSFLYIIIYSLVRHKEMRFIIIILPLLYILMSYCLVVIYNRTPYKMSALFIFFILIIGWLFISFSSLKNTVLYQYQQDDGVFKYFQNYAKDVKGKIWITNPLYALYSNVRIDGLIYYYTSKNLINFVDKNINDVDVILINDCDILCPPQELDNFCEENHKLMYMKFKNFKNIYTKEINSCNYKIFTRTTS